MNDTEQPRALADSPEMMTPGEVGKVLRHSEQTIRRWCKAGPDCKFPNAVMIGQKRLIPRSDVQALLA